MFNFALIVQSGTVHEVFKGGILLLLVLYILFLLIILKQIRSMNTIITQPNLFPIIQGALFSLIGFTLFIFLLGVAIL